MKPVMYLFANKGLGMSTGKTAAQVAHAAVQAYRVSTDDMVDAWMEGDHYTKLVMEARDTEHLMTIDRYLKDRGFNRVLIIDEGRTEISPHTPTALGVEIVDKDDPHVAAAFGDFRTYRDDKPKAPQQKGFLKLGRRG